MTTQSVNLPHLFASIRKPNSKGIYPLYLVVKFHKKQQNKGTALFERSHKNKGALFVALFKFFRAPFTLRSFTILGAAFSARSWKFLGTAVIKFFKFRERRSERRS